MIETVQTDLMARRKKRPAAPHRQEGPTRSCVGCGLRTTPAELVRCILGPDSELIVDLAGGGFGRGAWVHARESCLRGALSRGFARSFKQRIDCDYQTLTKSLCDAAERRVVGLLRAAQSSRKLVFGSQAVFEIRDSAKLVLLASDARASAGERFLQDAAAKGRLIVWSSKAWFGDVVGRGDVAVLALTDSGLADAVARALSYWRLGAGSASPTTEDSIPLATDALSVVAQPASGALQIADDASSIESSFAEQPAEIPEVR